jgi:hypothetical protein
MEEITILIHTHSDYSYLWRLISDFVKNIPLKKILAYNKIPSNVELPNYFDNYIKYDENFCYAKRMYEICNKINEKYIFLIHDVDIILNIDVEVLKIYLNIIKDNDIDRVHTAIFNGQNQIKYMNYALCDLNKPLLTPSTHFIPIDCTPAIWKKNSFIKLLSLFPNETYASMELTKEVIDYCKNNFKCYGIQYTDNLIIKYNRCLTMCTLFLFLHITTKGKFTLPLETYMDLQNDVEEIIKKYNINIYEIGTCGYEHLLKFKRVYNF